MCVLARVCIHVCMCVHVFLIDDVLMRDPFNSIELISFDSLLSI